MSDPTGALQPPTGATGSGPVEGSAVARLLRAIRARLRVVWAWAVASLAAPVVAATALLLVLIGRLRPWGWPEPAALAVALGAVAVLAVVAVGQPLSWLAAARAADKGLGARDIFTSALQFRDLDDEFGREIRFRAERLAEHDTPSSQARTAVPLPGGRPLWIRWAVAGALTAVAVVLAAMANPQDAERRRLEMVEAQAEELAEQVEELADQIADEPAADPALTEEVQAGLAELAEDLRQVDSLEEAAELLDQQAADLAADRSPDFASQQAAVRGLERSLATRPLPGEPSGSPAEQLAELAEGLDDLSAAEQQELAERLAELAEAQAAGDPATAAALADAAQQLAAGDTAGAQAALGEAAAAQGANADSVAAQQAAAQASGQLSNLTSRARRGETSSATGSGEGQGEGEGSGDGEGQGEGSGQGSGSGSGSGQGSGSGSGQGSGSGSGQGAGGQGGSGAQGTVGGAAGGSGQGQGGVGRPGGIDQPDVEGDNSGFTIVDPSALAEGDPLELGGTSTGEGQTETVGRGEGLTTAGQSRIPVSDIIGDYSQRASTALDRNRLSPGQQELVGNYFDLLTTGGP